MSNNNSEEKSLPPSEKKLKDLRKKGQISRSNDMVTGAVASVSILYIWLSGGRFIEAYKKSIGALLEVDRSDFAFAAVRMSGILAIDLGRFVAFLVLLVVVTTFLANFLINRGFLFSLEPIKLDFNKINPVEGFKRLISFRSLIDVTKNLIKIAVFLLLSVVALSFQLNGPFQVPYCGYGCFRTTFMALLTPILLIAIIMLLSFGALDIGIQRWLFLRQQRMTKTEAKRERKDQEGTPEVRTAQRRNRQRLLQAGQYSREDTTLFIEGSSAIVGVRFVRGETPVPIIVCKGRGRQFSDLLDFAIENKVPTYRDDEVALAMYQKLEIGSPLSEAFFEPFIKALKALRLV